MEDSQSSASSRRVPGPSPLMRQREEYGRLVTRGVGADQSHAG